MSNVFDNPFSKPAFGIAPGPNRPPSPPAAGHGGVLPLPVQRPGTPNPISPGGASSGGPIQANLPPVITHTSPASGPPGTQVTVYGAHLTDPTISIGDHNVGVSGFVPAMDSQFTFLIPTDVPSETTSITVSTGAGVSSIPFTVTSPASTPISNTPTQSPSSLACPPGYEPDPMGSGVCTPIMAGISTSGGSATYDTGGTGSYASGCPAGYELDPAGSGQCVPSPTAVAAVPAPAAAPTAMIFGLPWWALAAAVGAIGFYFYEKHKAATSAPKEA